MADQLFLPLSQDEAHEVMTLLRAEIDGLQSDRIKARDDGLVEERIVVEGFLKRLRKVRNRLTTVSDRKGWHL
jgi:hypothetical protein